MADEHPLPGGLVNDVVLKDGSVRRPLGAHSAFVHRLLRHFEDRGWGGAPRFLGIDEDGREMLSFFEGHAAIEQDRSPYAESDASLEQLAAMVREFHDLAADAAFSGEAETVCHNDLSPKNTVYAGEGAGALPVALIDWDTAAPGERIDDLAHLCWQHLRLGPLATDPAETARRMRLVCDAYGLDRDRRGRLVEAVLGWQDRCRRGIESKAAAGEAAMVRLRERGTPAWIGECRQWVAEHRGELEAAL
ncbi:phosphotransferase [Glycomyces arizonensis]|uniref:phosphotransferase n=1 Tax=Glycomyces arizonensis TaxID=256035 RepID=UPI00040B8736|nr:phosphotransferase [Glycomyces arizonensis]